MKNKTLIPFLILGLIILISNYNPIQYLISTFLDNNYFKYSNYNGSFTTKEDVFKGDGYEGINNEFQNYLNDSLKTKTKKEKVIYRLFYRNPLRFWLWKDYVFNERYRLPYKKWEEIREVRGYDIKGYWRDYQKF